MKRILKYFAIGCVLAIAGIIFSANCAGLFNGMDIEKACILVMEMYLCVVVVTCTGIIVSKITSKQNEDNFDEKDN